MAPGSKNYISDLCIPHQWRTREGFGRFKPLSPPEIPKALQNPAKLNPIVKTVQKCYI